MQRQLNLTSRSNRLKGTYLLGTLALVSLCIGGAANVAQARPDIAHAGGEGRIDPYLNPVQSGPAIPTQSAPGQAPAQTSTTAQPVAVASLSTEQLPADAEAYAQREAKSKDLLKYRGGDAIVISASTLVIVLLVALLIVLLT